MSYLQVTAFRPSLCVSDQYNIVRGSAIQRNAPVNIFDLHKHSLRPTIGSPRKCTELMKYYVRQRTGASRYQQCTPVCLFGGKGESKNGNEASPWKSIEKAMSSFKKEQSLEDVLRQQMEKQDYYDGGSGGNPPGGSGGGGGGGFGGTDDEGFAGILDDIVQVTLAILALIVLYLYIVAGDQVILFITDSIEFLSGKKGPRIRTILYEFGRFYQKFKTRVPYDPYWLEKAIITTPTWWDSPMKYRRMLRSSGHRPPRRAIASDSDDNAYSDDMYNDNSYDEDSDNSKAYNGNAYRNKAYNDNDDDYAYGEDVDDDF